MIIERTTSASYGGHHEIIGQVVAGNRDAGEQFVLRYGPLVHSILRRLDMRDDDKDDLFQQVFESNHGIRCLNQLPGGRLLHYTGPVSTTAIFSD